MGHQTKTGAQTHVKCPLWEILLLRSKTQGKVKMAFAEDSGKGLEFGGGVGEETKIALQFRACQPPSPEFIPAGS